MVSDDYDGQVVPGGEYGPNVLPFTLQLMKTPEKLNQEIDPTGNRTRVRCMRGNDDTPRPQRQSKIICTKEKHCYHVVHTGFSIWF